jgi:hypothetical protein
MTYNIWTDDDDILLDIMLSKKIKLDEIALILNKSLFDIQHRIVITDLYNKYKLK